MIEDQRRKEKRREEERIYNIINTKRRQDKYNDA